MKSYHWWLVAACCFGISAIAQIYGLINKYQKAHPDIKCYNCERVINPEQSYCSYCGSQLRIIHKAGEPSEVGRLDSICNTQKLKDSIV